MCCGENLTNISRTVQSISYHDNNSTLTGGAWWSAGPAADPCAAVLAGAALPSSGWPASMLATFARLATGKEIPVREDPRWADTPSDRIIGARAAAAATGPTRSLFCGRFTPIVLALAVNSHDGNGACATSGNARSALGQSVRSFAVLTSRHHFISWNDRSFSGGYDQGKML